ncbi:hypothetical protein [Nocardia sp. NPDC004604]|uniref:hypothetical protein n=1 Tax=Nocardia sp. NPDC004604 TaxID=3157013 RepID=UPI0033A4529C
MTKTLACADLEPQRRQRPQQLPLEGQFTDAFGTTAIDLDIWPPRADALLPAQLFVDGR